MVPAFVKAFSRSKFKLPDAELEVLPFFMVFSGKMYDTFFPSFNFTFSYKFLGANFTGGGARETSKQNHQVMLWSVQF